MPIAPLFSHFPQTNSRKYLLHAVLFASDLHRSNMVLEQNWLEYLEHFVTLVTERFDFEVSVIDAVFLEGIVEITNGYDV